MSENKPKFTPGPWHIYEPPEDEDPRDYWLTIADKQDEDVCKVCSETKGMMDDVLNAIIIKECPNMYALLIELRDNYVQNPNGIRKINEQLAKCRGTK